MAPGLWGVLTLGLSMRDSLLGPTLDVSANIFFRHLPLLPHCMFLRHHGGELAAALRAYEKKRGSLRRIRIVERAGISLKKSYFQATPGQRIDVVEMTAFHASLGQGMVESAIEKT